MSPCLLLACRPLLPAEKGSRLGRSDWDLLVLDNVFYVQVLSIGKALSIQAHPDKKLAERLFKERPDVYKDGNHKVSPRWDRSV